MTSGYIFRDDPELLNRVIETAHKAGAAALGVKLERYLDRIPQNVIKTADRLAFPIIGIPLHYAHTDIINPILLTLSNEMVKRTHISDDIHKQFLEIILNEDSVDSILSLLGKYIHRELLFIDLMSGDRYYFSNSTEFTQAIGSLPLPSLLNHFSHEAITLRGKRCGYLFFSRQVDANLSEVHIAQALEALQLHMLWAINRWKIESGRDEQFVQDVIYKHFRHESEILSRGRTIGWDLSGERAVILIGVAHPLVHEIHEPYAKGFEIFRKMLGNFQADVPCSHLEEKMVFIIKAPRNDWMKTKGLLTKIGMEAQRTIRFQTGLQLVIGVGAPVNNILSCDKSFREAEKTLAAIKEADNTTDILFWDDLGAYKFLAPIHETQEAKDFICEYLTPFFYKGESNFDDSLLQTLFCIIKNNWQLKPVAKSMNLHYNTVKYRYRKISEMLGKDIDSFSVRIDLALAMELYQMNNTQKNTQE